MDILFVVIPTQYIQATLKPLKKIIKKNCILVNCAKGIDIKSTSLISEVINKTTYQAIDWQLCLGQILHLEIALR